MVIAPRAGLILTLASGLFVIGGLQFGQPQCQADEPPKASIAQGRLQGRFTAEDSGKPVAGAKVRVLIEGVPGRAKFAEALSGPDGRYMLDVPLGHLSIWEVHSPSGYYTQDPTIVRATFTTKAEPLAVRDFVLQPGAAWRVEVRGVTLPADKPAIFSAVPNSDTNPQHLAPADIIKVESDQKGKAVLTVPFAAGRLSVGCNLMHSPGEYEIPIANLQMDKDFDPRKIKGMPAPVPEHKGTVRLRDAAGRSAMIEGVADGMEVFVESGQAGLRFPAKKVPAAHAFVLRGAAEDEAGKPIAGVSFTAAFAIGQGAAMSPFEASTDARGKFELQNVLLPQSSFPADTRVQMLAVKSGFDGAKTKYLTLLGVQKSGSGDFGKIVLKPGYSLRGKVVDENDKAVQGAVVMNVSDYFLYNHLICRTDAEGRFVMPDLAYRSYVITARFGEQFGDQRVDFNATSQEFLITLGPRPKSSKPASPPAR